MAALIYNIKGKFVCTLFPTYDKHVLCLFLCRNVYPTKLHMACFLIMFVKGQSHLKTFNNIGVVMLCWQSFDRPGLVVIQLKDNNFPAMVRQNGTVSIFTRASQN